MRKARLPMEGLPRRLRLLLYVLGVLLVILYVVHTRMYSVYLVNYRSNQEIQELRQQLEEERAKARELEWENRQLEGPEGAALAAVREGWGRPGQVRIKEKTLRADEEGEQGLFHKLADRLRDRLRGVKNTPTPSP